MSCKVLKCAKMFDAENQQVLENVMIFVKDNIIEKVCPWTEETEGYAINGALWYASFLSETFFSSTATLLPVRMDAIKGSKERPIAINVSSGLYHIIRTIAPMKVSKLSSIENVFHR